MKQPARSFPLPQSVPQEQVAGEQAVTEDTFQNPFQTGSQDESAQADAITADIYNYIYREGWDDITEDLKKGKANLAETLGTMAGNLLSNEIEMAEEEGLDVSRDMYVDMQSGIVQQLTEIVDEKKIKEFRDDNQVQVFMGEALTYAMNTVVTGGDTGITDESWIAMTQDMLTGGAQPEPQPVTGARVIEEVV